MKTKFNELLLLKKTKIVSKTKITFLLLLFLSLNSFAQCWQSISASNAHTLAIAQNGTLWAWGYNSTGQLGIGNVIDKSIPTQVGTASDWVKISAGSGFSAAIKSNGTLWTWGINSGGQLGIGSTISKTIPTQVGTDTDWSNISLGSDHAIALKTNGKMYGWGWNLYGSNGTGSNKNVPTQIGTQSNWTKISTGQYFSFAINSNGNLFAWGYNFSGQLGDGTFTNRSTPTQIGTATDWKEVDGGENFSMGIKNNGNVFTWGENENGQLGDFTLIDKSVPTQLMASLAQNLKSFSLGSHFVIAISQNDKLISWGNNVNGQLGNNSTNDVSQPIIIDSSVWNKVSAGSEHSIAIKNNNSIWSWGSNFSYQLGIGNGVSKLIPTAVTCPSSLSSDEFDSIENVISISPNPTKDFINISSKEKINTAEIYDINGRMLLKTNKVEDEISLENLNSGIYLLKLQLENGQTEIHKIIKK